MKGVLNQSFTVIEFIRDYDWSNDELLNFTYMEGEEVEILKTFEKDNVGLQYVIYSDKIKDATSVSAEFVDLIEKDELE